MTSTREEHLDEGLAPPANMPWLRHKIDGYEVSLTVEEVKSLRAKGWVMIYQLIKPPPQGNATLEYRVDKGKSRIPRITAYAAWENRWTGKKEETVYRGGITGTLRWIREAFYDYHDLPLKTRSASFQKVAGYVADGLSPALPYKVRSPGEMPFWASRMICRVNRFEVVYRLGHYYWAFRLKLVKHRDIPRDDGR